MASITVTEFHNLFVLRSSLDDGEDQEMVSLSVIAAHFMDWTDPRKTVTPRSGGALAEKVVDATPHAIIARDALERICTSGCSKEERKLLVNGLVGKCYLPKEVGKELLKEVYEKVTEAIDAKVMVEALGRNILARVEVAVGRLLSEMQEEEGGDATIVRSEEETGAEDDDEEEEGEEGDVTIVPGTEGGGEEVAEVDQGEESERTPAVTEDEEED